MLSFQGRRSLLPAKPSLCLLWLFAGHRGRGWFETSHAPGVHLLACTGSGGLPDNSVREFVRSAAMGVRGTGQIFP